MFVSKIQFLLKPKGVLFLFILGMMVFVPAFSTAGMKARAFAPHSTPCFSLPSTVSGLFSANCNVGTFQINAPSSCSWTVTSTVNWIQINSPVSGGGSGSGVVRYSVAVNTTGAPRLGNIEVRDASGARATYRVAQAGVSVCILLCPTDNTVPGTGGQFSFDVSSSCSWITRVVYPPNVTPWISNVTPAGTGNQTVYYSVPLNTDGQRTATIEVVQQPSGTTQVFGVTQLSNAGCNYSLNPTQGLFPASGGTGGFWVNAGGSPTNPGVACFWIVESTRLATNLTRTEGVGSQQIHFTIPENTSTSGRTGYITVVGSYTETGYNPITYTIYQAGRRP